MLRDGPRRRARRRRRRRAVSRDLRRLCACGELRVAGRPGPRTAHDYTVPPNLCLSTNGRSPARGRSAPRTRRSRGRAGAHRLSASTRATCTWCSGRAGGKPVRFRVTIDGAAPAVRHGTDVDADGTGVVTEQRLYQFIRQPGPWPTTRSRSSSSIPAFRPTRSRSDEVGVTHVEGSPTDPPAWSPAGRRASCASSRSDARHCRWPRRRRKRRSRFRARHGREPRARRHRRWRSSRAVASGACRACIST